jgi:hypothetical protein
MRLAACERRIRSRSVTGQMNARGTHDAFRSSKKNFTTLKKIDKRTRAHRCARAKRSSARQRALVGEESHRIATSMR